MDGEVMITLYDMGDKYRYVDSEDITTIRSKTYFGKGSAMYDDQVKHMVEQGLAEIKPYSEFKPHYVESRKSSLEDGGYGYMDQQLEMLFDKIEILGGPSDANILESIRNWYRHIEDVRNKYKK
jgi:hypothetical protein